jgi:DNA-binding MarR family transcriptional regulator
MAEVNPLVELVNLWSEFEKSGQEPTIYDFCLWYFKREATEIPKPPDEIDAEITENETGHLLRRVGKFQEFYTKKALEKGGMNNFDEYFFLDSIQEFKDARKTDIVEKNVVDVPSGIDIIKRLEKNRLADSLPDQADKRALLIRLTQRGRQLVQKNAVNVQNASELLLTPLNTKEKELFKNLLDVLNNFHSKDYSNETRKSSFDELVGRLGKP